MIDKEGDRESDQKGSVRSNDSEECNCLSCKWYKKQREVTESDCFFAEGLADWVPEDENQCQLWKRSGFVPLYTREQIQKVMQNFDERGIIEKITYSEFSLMLPNDIHGYNPANIRQARTEFGDDNSGNYPDIEGHQNDDGCWQVVYITISGRSLVWTQDKTKSAIGMVDCSDWWKDSESFRSIVVEGLKRALYTREENWETEKFPAEIEPCVHDKVEIGRIYTLGHTPPNNHGCQGYYVDIQTIDENIGIVVDGRGCGSCWQTGCDSWESPIPIGTVVKLPEGYCWECASEEDPEQIDQSFSRTDGTIVDWSELEILGEETMKRKEKSYPVIRYSKNDLKNKVKVMQEMDEKIREMLFAEIEKRGIEITPRVEEVINWLSRKWYRKDITYTLETAWDNCNCWHNIRRIGSRNDDNMPIQFVFSTNEQILEIDYNE